MEIESVQLDRINIVYGTATAKEKNKSHLFLQASGLNTKTTAKMGNSPALAAPLEHRSNSFCRWHASFRSFHILSKC
jgi:hypothetical protein